jgi:hypothetical protein
MSWLSKVLHKTAEGTPPKQAVAETVTDAMLKNVGRERIIKLADKIDMAASEGSIAKIHQLADELRRLAG